MTTFTSRRRVWAMSVVMVVAIVASPWGGLGHRAEAACDHLNIGSVAIERCVVPGDQAQIDDGFVVRVDDLSTPSGHWLAGHRTTHGATFNSLTAVRLGDLVEYRGERYTVVEYARVRFDTPGHTLGWTRSAIPTIVLQTSVDDSSAHLWRAEATPAHTSDSPAGPASPAGRIAPATRVSTTTETPTADVAASTKSVTGPQVVSVGGLRITSRQMVSTARRGDATPA